MLSIIKRFSISRSYLAILSLSIYSPPGFAWSPYVVCNDGAMVIDFQNFPNTSKGAGMNYAQYVIRDRGVVDYFKGILPDLGLHAVIGSPTIFAENGEIRFTTADQREVLDVLPKTNPPETYVVLARREGNGVKIVFSKDGSHAVDWFFEDCKRVNTAQSSFDPLGFWYAPDDCPWRLESH